MAEMVVDEWRCSREDESTDDGDSTGSSGSDDELWIQQQQQQQQLSCRLVGYACGTRFVGSSPAEIRLPPPPPHARVGTREVQAASRRRARSLSWKFKHTQ
ncbi:hypothetical protein CAPTEDRAFT_214668, partial [Capitella teleta]